MRSRPELHVYLQPGVVGPGETLVVESVLTSKSETPIDFIEMRLTGTLLNSVGAGESHQEYRQVFYDRVWKSKEGKLTPGEHRFRVEYVMRGDAPPSYKGIAASIVYELDVHVSIPWWPDRRKRYVVPVKMPPITPGPDPRSGVFATSRRGPRGTEPFMEVALDATDVALGDVVSGRISLSNLGGRTVRGVDLSFVEMEAIKQPIEQTNERGRFRLRVHEGQPAEGEAIPFRVRIPERAAASFSAGAIEVRTHLEVRADLAWGNDVVVRAPLAIAPAKRTDRHEGRVEPVGRERMLAVWQAAATKAGFVVAAGAETGGDGMHGMRGAVRVRITSGHRDGDYWLVAELRFPSIGLDLDVTERSWRDVLALDAVKTGDEAVDKRFTIHAREQAQAKPFVDAFIPKLVAFEDVKAGDDAVNVASRGSVHSTERVDAFLSLVLITADALDAARSLVGPPAVLAANVPAWRALAEQLGGVLELGRMHIVGRLGTAAVEVFATWSPGGIVRGFSVVVPIDPVLAAAPASPDDPALSPSARAAWKTLLERTPLVEVRHDVVSALVEKKVDDPAEHMPLIEAAVALRRALAGIVAAGPFR